MADLIGKDYKFPYGYGKKPSFLKRSWSFLTRPNIEQEDRPNQALRKKLDRRKDNIHVYTDKRALHRRTCDKDPEAVCARVILRTIYDKGDMRAFDKYWQTVKHLFEEK